MSKMPSKTSPSPVEPLTPQPTRGNNLAVRVAAAAVFLPLFFTLLYFGERPAAKFVFAAFMGVALWMGAREMVFMARKGGLDPSLPGATAVGWALLVHFFLQGGVVGNPDWLPLWAVLAGGLFVIHFGALWFDKDPVEGAQSSQAVTWMTALVLGLGFGIQLKLFMFNDTTLTNTGARLVLALYLIVWLGDTLAYFAGKALGKHKFAPRVSPKKTWEGAAGNLLGNLLGALVAKLLVCTQWSMVDVVLLGTLVGLAGVFGDLVESTWKRSTGVKDSTMGLGIPGHGGILDRFDSLLFAAPALYLYVHFVHGLN